MNLQKILTDLEQGRVDVAQVEANILEALEDTRISNSVPSEHKEWFQAGVDCAMIRLGLKSYFESEATHV